MKNIPIGSKVSTNELPKGMSHFTQGEAYVVERDVEGFYTLSFVNGPWTGPYRSEHFEVLELGTIEEEDNRVRSDEHYKKANEEYHKPSYFLGNLMKPSAIYECTMYGDVCCYCESRKPDKRCHACGSKLTDKGYGEVSKETLARLNCDVTISNVDKISRALGAR